MPPSPEQQRDATRPQPATAEPRRAPDPPSSQQPAAQAPAGPQSTDDRITSLQTRLNSVQSQETQLSTALSTAQGALSKAMADGDPVQIQAAQTAINAAALRLRDNALEQSRLRDDIA